MLTLFATTNCETLRIFSFCLLFSTKIALPEGSEINIGIPNSDFQDLVNLVFTSFFVAATAAVVATADSEKILLPLLWQCIHFVSLFQIVRNPVALKNALRPFRVALGPTTALGSVLAGVLQMRAATGDTPIALTAIGAACAACSFAACVVFRPDNSEIRVAILRVRMEERTAKKVHALLNMASFFGAIAMSSAVDGGVGGGGLAPFAAISEHVRQQLP